ncbi:MAG: RluA family pseudouridine synthase, partial [Clostridia bacterium]|nr:RluA family pseudouridine synthase [Clostridia bacterium]
MKSFVITKNDANQRLDKYLQKSFPNLPKTLMYKYIRTKKIKVNSKKSDIAYRLQEGDKVDLYIKDEFFVKPETRYDFTSAPDKINIIFEDENIILLNKPVGLLCHPDDKEYCDTLISRVKKYLFNKKEYDPEDENSFTPALVNRIDRNTGGIVIAAKNSQSLRILNSKMKNREIHKCYRCILIGTPE